MKARIADLSAIALLMVLVSACTSRQLTTMNPGAVLTQESRFQVGSVANATGHDIKVDYQTLWKEALQHELDKAGLLAGDTRALPIVIDTKVTEYAEGSAVARWLVPGVGATKITVVSELKSGGTSLGTIEARRTVNAGGLYTIGAWKGVFETVAQYTVDQLKEKMKGAR